jgi:hypothetical protein
MIRVIEDVLSQSFIDELLQWNEQTKAGDVWSSNQTKWVDVLKYATGGTILSRALPDEWKNPIYYELVNRGKLDYLPYGSSAILYMGFATSCVNWHPDYVDYDAMSIYLNKEWDSNWGGWFAWTEEDKGVDAPHINPKQGQFYCPQYNTAIHSTEREWHCTTPLATVAPPRISIQLFFSKKPNG